MDWELLDWDRLHGSETESGSSSVIDDGMILTDHFSVDNLIKKPDRTPYGVLESGRVESRSESPNQIQYPGEVQVDLVDDAGDGLIRVSDCEAPDENHLENEALLEIIGGTVASKFLSESENLKDSNERYVEDSSKCWSDSVGNDLKVSGDSGFVNLEVENVSDSEVASTEAIEESGENAVGVVAANSAVRSDDESKSRETVWWKMPFVLLKYYAFKIGPVWSVSMAATLMGLVLLGRRLYNMKKKAQRFHLKVTMDDKKASQVMNPAIRLNEMFTDVRRVPVIRPALPSPGAWPVLTLR